MNSVDTQYLSHMQTLLREGAVKENRTGTDTVSIFGHQMRFDLRKGFPILTTKKVFMKGVIHELLWFLNGETNIKYLKDNGVNIWNEWADENGNLGPVYGYQWRKWKDHSATDGGWAPYGHVDQIANVIETLKTNPDSRRMVVTAWNPAEVKDQALPPCHLLFQFNTQEIPLHTRYEICRRDNPNTKTIPFCNKESMDALGVPSRYIDCQLYQRSADWFLGVPFNIASYALLNMMIGRVVNMIPRHFVHSFGDTHLYANHHEQAIEQISRRPHFTLPTMVINNRPTGIDEFTYDDFDLQNYNSHESIKAEVAV